MLKKMKEQIVENLKKARERGEVTAEQVQDIIQNAVSNTAKSVRGKEVTVRDITRDATTACIEELEKTGSATKEHITAVVEGAVNGVKEAEKDHLEAVQQELQQLKSLLTVEEEKLATSVRGGLEGAREAAGIFPGEVKTYIEIAVTDAKLKSAELLGLTRETVKQAVRKAIEKGQDVEETIEHITSDATEKAMAEGRFSADRVKKISYKVLSAAVETAEETGTHVNEVIRGAVKGIREGITDSVESVKNDLSSTGEKAKAFISEDIAQTKEDLETIEDLFLETMSRVAHRSGDVAKDVLSKMVEQARGTTSDLKVKAADAADAAAVRLKELGKDTLEKTVDLTGEAAHKVAKEAGELSKRAVDVAKGSLSGMWKGAKNALKKGNEDKI